MTFHADPGFAPIFKGWNVWDVYALNNLHTEIGGIGVSDDRRLRIWVENEIKDHAPAAAVDDQANPNKLVGAMIEIIQNAGTLSPAARRVDLPGAPMLLDGPATLHTVRFFNRGDQTELSWPHNDNFLLDTAYEPSAASPITSGAAPSSLAGDVGAAAESIKHLTVVVLEVAAIGAGVGLLIWLASHAARKRRAA